MEFSKLGWIESSVNTAGQPDFLSPDRKRKWSCGGRVGSVL